MGLISLDDLKVWTGSSVDDTRLEALIDMVSADIELHCDRRFGQQVVEESAPERLRGHGRQLLRLRHYPVTAVSLVRIDGVEQVAGDDYLLSGALAEQGLLFRFRGWPARVRAHADLTQDGDPATADLSIEVAYTAGYTTIPQALQGACLKECLARLATPAAANIRGERTVAGWSREYWQRKESNGTPFVSIDVAAALAPFERC